MSSTAGAVAASLGAATLFGLATALQHQQARSVEQDATPGLLLTLARKPLWVLSMAVDLSAVGLQGLALGLGSVALVQSLLVAGLPLAAVLSAAMHHRRLSRHEVTGVVLCALALALLGPALAATPSEHVPSRTTALLTGLVVAAAAAWLMALRRLPRLGPACAGASAGTLIGASSVLLAVVAHRIGAGEPLLSTWAPYAAVVTGLLALQATQVAFQTGELGRPLAALSVVEPLVAVALAVAVLHESLPTSGLKLVAIVVGGVLAVLSVLVLSAEEHPEHPGPTAPRAAAADRSG
jgi:drug/metabolite transporter (DMT)-like permease